MFVLERKSPMTGAVAEKIVGEMDSVAVAVIDGPPVELQFCVAV